MIYYINGSEKKTYMPTAPISRIFSSVSLVKSLANIGVWTLDDMMHLGKDVVCQTWGLTEQNKEEIAEFMDKLWSAPDGFRLCAGTAETVAFLDSERKKAEPGLGCEKITETPLDVLELPNKIKNALIRAGITSVEALQETEKDQLSRLPHLGEVSAKKVNQAVRVYVQSILYPQNTTAERDPSELQCLEFLHELSGYCSCLKLRVYREIQALFYSAFQENREIDLTQIYETTSLRQILKKELAARTEKDQNGASRQDARNFIPEELLPSDVLDDLLKELEQKREVDLRDELSQIRQPRALVYIAENVSESRLRDVLTQRIHGVSLDVLAQKYNISRGQVRGMSVKWYLSKKVTLHEDKYVPIYKKYYFTKNDFMDVFGESEETYHYLRMVCRKKGTCPLDNAYDEPAVSALQTRADRRKGKGANNAITLEGNAAFARRNDLVEHLVLTQFRDGGTVSAFSEMYESVVKEKGMEADSVFGMVNLLTFEDILLESTKTLCSLGRQFRYYDVWKNDYTRLLEDLNLEQYQNIEISTKKMYKEHPDLMKAYDIRNEYELHNLLRKISTQYTLPEISFGRMPHLKFGEANTEEHIYNLLQQHSPVSKKDLLGLYQEAYGVKLHPPGKYLAPFDKYYDGHMYNLSMEVLSANQLRKLKKELTQDSYSLDEVQELCWKLFKTKAPEQLNSETVEQLGYRLYSNFILSKRYPDTTAYYLHFLTTGTVVDFSQIPSYILVRKAFYDTLHRLERDHQLLEFAPKVYATEKGIKAYGLSAETMVEFCQTIRMALPEKQCFTIHWLKKHLDLQFPGEHLDDFIYGSILTCDKESFTSTTLVGIHVFCRGKSSDVFADLVKQLLDIHGSMTLEQLVDLLSSEYGITTRESVLAARLRKSKLSL